jgi:hypothetical protein
MKFSYGSRVVFHEREEIIQSSQSVRASKYIGRGFFLPFKKYFDDFLTPLLLFLPPSVGLHEMVGKQ